MALNKKHLLVVSALTITFATSYIIFAGYHPKVITELREVKGISTTDSNSLNLPYPKDAERVSKSKSGDNEQITFESLQPKEEIITFYKNVLLSKHWKLSSQGSANGFVTERYEREGNKVTITVIQNENSTGTLVNIGIYKD